MDGKLSEALLRHRPRERSGSVAPNRFSFQRTWAFCHLLRLHRSGSDYVLLFEFHDDVMVLDSPRDPTHADFYQVKTRREGAWTETRLLSCEVRRPDRGKPVPDSPETPRSILGKLLDHAGSFGPHVRSLNLVSNARYDVPLAVKAPSKDREQICLLDLSAEAQKAICACLREELGPAAAVPLDRVFLIATGISLTDHETYGAGELASLLEARQQNNRAAVQALYRTISDEIQRRSNNEWEQASFSELCRRRGICRVEVEAFLQQAESQPDPLVALEAVKTQLGHEGLSYKDIIGLGFAWSRYQVQITDHSDEMMMAFQGRVRNALQSVMARDGWTRLVDLLTLAEREFLQAYGEPDPPLDRELLKGAILLECKALETRGLQTVDPQPSTEAP